MTKTCDKNKICQLDNQFTFTEPVEYAVRCEACQLFCKIYKYRSCEKRHKWLAEQGIDVYEKIREIDKVAQNQIGGSSSLPPISKINKTDNKDNKTPSRHRGRK